MNVREVLPTCRKVNKLIAVVPGVVLCSLAMFLGGCGGGGQTEWVPTEEDNVKLALSDVSGAASDPQAFRAMFVEGAAPPDSERAKYAPFMYRPQSMEFDGATATVMVEVEDGNTSQIVGEVQWTLVLEGEQWKLKTAPLP